MKDINLVRKIAWSFHKTSGLDWDELFQEATLSYFEALKTYDKKRGKITTYVWYHIMSDLKDYAYRERCTTEPLCDLKEATNIEHTDHSFLDTIPLEIREEVNLILNSADKIDSILLSYEDLSSKSQQEVGEKSRMDAVRFIRSLLFQEGRNQKQVRNVMTKLRLAFTY